jgi:hypothetical protein
MLIELVPDKRSCVAPLFNGYPYLHGSIAAAARQANAADTLLDEERFTERSC